MFTSWDPYILHTSVYDYYANEHKTKITQIDVVDVEQYVQCSH